MACGLPVAAYPVTGPKDIIKEGITGAMNENLEFAINKALTLNPQNCIDYAQQSSWSKVTKTFANQLHNGRHSSPRRSLFDYEYMDLRT